jgi:hypothetical protein
VHAISEGTGVAIRLLDFGTPSVLGTFQLRHHGGDYEIEQSNTERRHRWPKIRENVELLSELLLAVTSLVNGTFESNFFIQFTLG